MRESVNLMCMQVEFINHREWGIDIASFTPFIKRLEDVMDVLDGVLNVVFVDDAHIHSLNKNYRKIDKPTDVLSFNYQDEVDNGGVVGEVYISVETAERQAEEYQHTLSDELHKLFVHGFLHIHGYDHEEDSDYIVMSALEENILNKR